MSARGASRIAIEGNPGHLTEQCIASLVSSHPRRIVELYVSFHSRSDYDVAGVCDALYYALSGILL